jgi:hypothetical protein
VELEIGQHIARFDQLTGLSAYERWEYAGYCIIKPIKPNVECDLITENIGVEMINKRTPSKDFQCAGSLRSPYCMASSCSSLSPYFFARSSISGPEFLLYSPSLEGVSV